MTLPDLHPDELLQRASQDRITPDERADLGAHLQRCPACALELAVRGDAAKAGISSETDHAVAARVVERVLEATVPLKAPHVGGHWRGRLARAAMVALMLTSTAVGASAIAVRVQDRRAAAAARAAQTTPAAVAVAPRAHRERAPVTPASPPPTEPPVPAEVPGPTEATATGRLPSEEAGVRPRARPAQPTVVGAPAEMPVALQPPALAHTAAALDSAAPAVVLARAEAARAARRFGDAMRLYEDLAARFPGSREEIVARVLHGQLLLDEIHDAPAALRWFERYLASEPAGSLAEEARLGRAQALQLRGSPADERAAWEELLARHPASVHAGTARARLAALRTP
jgi:hypothetical protein